MGTIVDVLVVDTSSSLLPVMIPSVASASVDVRCWLESSSMSRTVIAIKCPPSPVVVPDNDG